MIKGNGLTHMVVTLILALASCHCAVAQVEDLVSKGDSLRRIYHFAEALEAYDQALTEIPDTTYEDSILFDAVSHKLLLAEKGLEMSGSVCKLKVLGKRLCSLDDFYLYYPLENRSWRMLPNILDSDTTDTVVRGLYAPDWNNVHYYSAKAENGRRSIFVTYQQDTVWTLPHEVEGISTEQADEIYPMLSPDGKTMYFSSDDMYSLGGYDLYYSTWDESEGCWSVPQNMGLPFSSPADDFLYVDSEDERYSLFASTRDCPEDSVWVYSVAYERDPVRVQVDDPQELLAISRLDLDKTKTDTVKTVTPTDDLWAIYMARVGECTALKDSISSVQSYLDELREDLGSATDESGRMRLSTRILEVEQKIPYLQQRLDVAKEKRQKAEEDFRREGVIGGSSSMQDDEEGQDIEEYEFTRLSPGDSLKLNIDVPKVEFDYSFKVLDQAVFAENQELPSGIVYQIQLFGLSSKADIQDLKGLSPVYESVSPSGMYIYRVGRFCTHDEASCHLEEVRGLGFRDVSIRAFQDGKEISVAKARTLQERLKGGFSLYEIHLIPDSGVLNPDVVETLHEAAMGKDIIRTESEDGTQIFTVGPFDVKADADALVETLSEMMSGSVVCEPVNN